MGRFGVRHSPSHVLWDMLPAMSDGSPTGLQRDPLVAHLEGEVTYLRERLDEADRQRGSLQRQLEAERQRADVLQLRAINTGPPDTPPDASGSTERDDRGLQGVLGLGAAAVGRPGGETMIAGIFPDPSDYPGTK